MSAPADPGRPHAQTARARLAERAARVRRLRRRVFATAAATFALAFGVIATTGSLGQQSATAAGPETGSGAAGAGTSGPATTLDPSTSAQDDGGTASTSPGMTTRQS